MYIKTLSELDKNYVCQAGGKGASLGEMYNSGIPVPNGFVVTSEAFNEFVKCAQIEDKINAILKLLKSDSIDEIDKASIEIQKIILDNNIPDQMISEIKKAFCNLDTKYVAVRSSATAEDSVSDAWAGQLDSFLNTTQSNLIDNIKKCWASLFTPRAIFYRIEKELTNKKISVAVVVQKMVESEKSGIAFSIHPVTQDKNDMVIEAGFGLGEAIVSGQITPDNYLVKKQPLRIINKTINTQNKALYRAIDNGNEWKDIDYGKNQTLSDEQILELANEIIKIEKHFGFAVDVEWAYEKKKLYILQSRPITTFDISNKTCKTKIVYKTELTRDRSIITQQAWTNAHAGQDGMQKLLSAEFSYKIPTILFYNDGPVEIWDNEEAYAEMMQIIADKNKAEPDFCLKVMAEFNDKENNFFKPIWNKNLTGNSSELLKLAKTFVELNGHYVYLYYTLITDTAHAKNKTAIKKWKEKDVFYENTGLFIERSLSRIYPELSYLTKYIKIEEIENPPSKNILSQRRKHWFYAPNFIDETITMETFMRKYPDIVFKKETYNPDMTIFYGQTASVGGTYKGKAKLLRTREEMDKVEDGDIIVAAMTIPEFLPAMKKAVAFVNDEGGMLSHAAVVARELKKPCILDTKFATQVIKDGNELEIDADNGIVKIIK